MSSCTIGGVSERERYSLREPRTHPWRIGGGACPQDAKTHICHIAMCVSILGAFGVSAEFGPLQPHPTSQSRAASARRTAFGCIGLGIEAIIEQLFPKNTNNIVSTHQILPYNSKKSGMFGVVGPSGRCHASVLTVTVAGTDCRHPSKGSYRSLSHVLVICYTIRILPL